MNGIAPRAHDTYHYPSADGSVTVGHAHDCWCLGGTEKALWEHTPTEASHVVEKEPWKPKVGEHVRIARTSWLARVHSYSEQADEYRLAYYMGGYGWYLVDEFEPI